MRNLKKLLALVLAMVMTFSLMLSASAVDFDDYQDKDSITAEFEESVAVLTGLEVMQGDEKGFRPSDKITRAEAAAVIYRAVTGDVTDRQTDLYKDYSTFVDVKRDDWFAGYVGYCQNAGYIKGTSPTTFNPYGQVTGYEVLAMILRAVGYGKNNEFTGSSWQVNVAALSKQLGVTRDVTAAHMEQTLNMAAPREVVADLVFMTMATVPMVTYTPALAYNDKQSITANIYNPTLGQQIFGLFHDVQWKSIDDWGRPGYDWFQNGVWRDNTWLTTANTGFGYVIPADHPWYWAPTSWTAADWADNVVATIGYDPSYETNEQVLECDVADALDIDDEEVFRLFVNGTNGGDGTGATAIGAVANNYRIVATDTVTKVGGQGRITEFYYNLTSKWFLDDTGFEDRAVMIDTMLVRIDAKRDAKLDPAGHVITPAQMEVTIYDGNNQGATNNSSSRVLSKDVTSTENWDEYSKGDYILINAWTDKTTAPVRNTAEQREAAAFQTNKVVNARNSILFTEGGNQRVWIVDNGNDGKAENFQAKQTTIFYNQGKHEVDGKEYKDQIELYLDLAGRTTGTTFTWFLDQFGNLIGIGDAHAVRFGVITGIYAAFGQGEDETTGRVKAVATVRYSDGTTGTEYIDAFRMSYGMAIPDADGTIAGNAANAAAGGANRTVNGLKIGYRTEPGTKLGNGGGLANDFAFPMLNAAINAPDFPALGDENKNTIELYPVYDTVAHPALSAGPVETTHSLTGMDVAQVGWLYLAPSSSTNSNAHFASGNTSTDAFHILYDNLFMFTAADDESVVATEVAGSWATNANSAIGTQILNATNTNPLFQDMANGISPDTNGKLYKSLSYLTYTPAALAQPNDAADTTGTAAAGTAGGQQQMVYVDNETEIMVKMGNNTASRTINTYKGVDELPGDVTIAQNAEIDWVDTDGDNRAEFVYISNGSIPSTVTYGLFYYNGTGAQWNGTNGTITGYLNGSLETVTFNRASFNAVNGSENSYLGHLFAVRMEDGNVTSVLRKAYANAAATFRTTPNILMVSSGAAAYDLINDSGSGLTAAPFVGVPGTTAGAGNATDMLATSSTAGSNGTATDIWADYAAATATQNEAATDALGAPVFVLGGAGGNSYSANTRAVYYRDNFVELAVAGDALNDTVLTYVRESGGNRIVAQTVGGAADNYWLAPNCVIVGELDWLNTNRCDVTMVYEEGAARSVTQIYISRLQSDITPSDYGTPVFAAGAGVTDFSNIAASNSAADFQTALRSLPNASLAYNSKNRPTAGAGWSSPAKDIMYFTFTTTAAVPVSLEIKDSAGNTRYFETATTGGSTNGFFGVNINPDTVPNTVLANQQHWVGGLGLESGTYTYTITVNGVPTSGTFSFTWG